MTYATIGGNYYGHVADYLFPSSHGYMPYSYPYYGTNSSWPWYGYGSYGYPYCW